MLERGELEVEDCLLDRECFRISVIVCLFS